MAHIEQTDLQSERRSQILDAAERCFARVGFHRATMQDVAAEAEMSPGNIYRYFPSKDAIVAGLAERDRTRLAADFAELGATPNFLEAFAQMGRKHLVEEPQYKAALALEIWAESSRNPSIAALCNGISGGLYSGMLFAFQAAQARGVIGPAVDLERAVKIVMTLADGLMKRRAVEPNFDGEAEIDAALAIIGAMLTGHVPLTLKDCAVPSHHSTGTEL